MGSGNWYRFDKKSTTGECHRVDVRYLRREGLLKSGSWFSLRWLRADRETGSIRCVVIGNEKAEQVILTYRHRSGPGAEWEDVQEPAAGCLRLPCSAASAPESTTTPSAEQRAAPAAPRS